MSITLKYGTEEISLADVASLGTDGACLVAVTTDNQTIMLRTFETSQQAEAALVRLNGIIAEGGVEVIVIDDL